MRIIKPYGRSHVDAADLTERKRVLRLNDGAKTSHDIKSFALGHDELIIAQWISSIDKIATKPSGNKGATPIQRKFRDQLGKTSWALLVEKDLLPGLKDPDKRAQLEKLWEFKVAPYGKAEFRDKLKAPNPKGRWFKRFAGDVDVTTVDADEVARRIHEHLYMAEYRLEGGNKRVGRIEARAKSIERNVLRPAKTSSVADNGWSDADWNTYIGAGDVAKQIWLAARARQEGRDGAGTRRVTASVAAIALAEQYAKLFAGIDGKPLGIKQAKSAAPGLFNLHMAIKDAYSRILKHRKKDQRQSGKPQRKVSNILPPDMCRLIILVKNKTKNQRLNALVREGKVIHYEASQAGGKDSPSVLTDNWPRDTSNSFYWTSDGQAEIKRNEAFVRIWRHVLALAARTLKDWADPNDKIKIDILDRGSIESAIGDSFVIIQHNQKLALLFGKRASVFNDAGDEDVQREVLELALKGIASLRHSAFHFKGLDSFREALTKSDWTSSGAARGALEALWQTDVKARALQRKKTLSGAHVEYFLDESQARKLMAALEQAAPASIPLPRFARVLLRTSHMETKQHDGLHLPMPANRADLEDPARLCQYTVLKLLYEQPFRKWLETRSTQTLN